MLTATTRPRTAPVPLAPGVVEPGAGRVWWRVYLHHLRLLRNSAIAWIAALAGLGAGVVATFELRHGSEAELEALAAMEGIAAFEMLGGRYVMIATAEGLVLSRWGMFAIIVAVWGMLAGVKLLRGAEESGHVEMLRTGAITSRRLLAAVLAALFTTYAIFAIAIGVSHTAAGMHAPTAWALGAAMGLLAASFAAAGAFASQLAASRSRAVSLVAALLGLALTVRVLAAATFTPDWVWWLTPFGWIGFLHEVDQAQIVVLGALAALLILLVAAALAVVRRDLHAGVVVGAEGSAERARPLRSQAGLALRLTAGPAATWGAVIAFLGLGFGLLARDFADAAAALPTTVEFTAQLGWPGLDRPEGIVALAFLWIAFLLALFAAAQAAAIREEEASWRLEHLLVRPIGRSRWLLTRIAFSAAALVLLAAAAGVAAWLGSVLIGTPIAFADGLRAAANVVPVAVLFLGIGIAALGLAPRVTAPLTYGLAVAAFLLDFVGGFLDLPEAVLDLSPYRHLAFVPAADIAVGPAVMMLIAGLLGVVVGLAAFRRRDLQEA
jgi:ABC-2 type transport system permease protein